MQDFGKVLARYVTVFNCSAGVDLRTTGRILAGLAQTGAWACLEELSRVPADVLSIVAAQIGSLMQVGDLCLRSVELCFCYDSAVQQSTSLRCFHVATQAVTERRSHFSFMGRDTRLVATCGVFATMHSEIEGQSKLPDSLKALLRPVRPRQACSAAR